MSGRIPGDDDTPRGAPDVRQAPCYTRSRDHRQPGEQRILGQLQLDQTKTSNQW